MATVDESATVCQGQPWAYWAEKIGFRNHEDVEKDDEQDEKREGDTMKLRKEDMTLFGFCPARDEFYLVVCEICGQVVKPQALKSHIELRHGGISPPKSERMERQNKMVSSSHDPSSTHLSPSKQQKSGTGPPLAPSPKYAMGSSSSTSSSSKSHSRHESKSKRNHSLAPVVRVERISPNMIKKPTPGVMNNLMNANCNLVPADKRELPSPQQPPPVQPAISVSQMPQPMAPKKGANAAGNETKPKSGGTSSKSKVPKERKLLLCKDRVYDPNKHCGVWVSETGKQCTRSLTCKTHSLALRRSVLGRKKNFDELLADHRAAKETLLKATQASKEAMQRNQNNSSVPPACASKPVPVSNKLAHQSSLSHRVLPPPVKTKSTSKGVSAASFNSRVSHASSVGTVPSKDIPHLHETAIVPVGERNEDKCTNSTAKTKSVESLYITHHPQPAAMCTFGARHMGIGYCVFNRGLDHLRAVLRTSFLDRNSHPPPSKKLCVESKLPPVPDFSDPSDPYNFSWVDQSAQAVAASHGVNIGNAGETSSSISSSSGAQNANAVKHSQAKLNKGKSAVNRYSKDVNLSPNTVNRTNASAAKRKRTNANNNNGGGASVMTSAGNVVVSADVGLITTALPVGQLHRNAIAMTKSSPVSIVDTNRIPIRNNSSKVPQTLGAVQAINKNHSYPSNTANEFRDLNIVVTSLDVANGQLPGNPGAAVLSRSIGGFHALANVPSTGVPLNIASTTVAAMQQHLERNSNKKNKNSNVKSGKGVNQECIARPSNLISPYLPGLITSGSVIVEGLPNAVALPATVNNVAVGNMSPHMQTSPSIHSPLFRSESASPQVSTSPLANGLGPSPPPTSNLHNKLVNHLLTGASPAAISPGRLTSISSPGADMVSPGNQMKANKSSTSRHNSSPKGLSKPSLPATSFHLPGSAQLALSRTASVPPRTTKSTTMAVSGITFQQVYANQVLGTAQLSQLQLPSKSGTIRTLPAGTPPPLTMRTQLPVNILSTAVPTVATGSASPGPQQTRPSFLLQTDDLRHTEIQGSPSLHT